MIFPIPEDYHGFSKTPATHALVFANVIIFFLFFWGYSLERNQPILEDKLFLSSTQKYYREWYLLTYDKEPEKAKSAQFTFRGLTDPKFMDELPEWQSDNDAIEFRHWKEQALDWKAKFTATPLSDFGLKSMGLGDPKSDSVLSFQWLTYQFSHSDLFHLLSNICFLFVLGIWIEPIMGSLFVLLLYLLGGVGGAFAFMNDGLPSMIPMVGASASVSALIAFVAVFHRGSGLRYFYFLSPMKNWYGMLYLPAWLLVPFYLVSDLSAYLLKSGEQISGVAHSAHLGGALVGFALGLLFSDASLFRRGETTTKSILGHTDRL